MKISTIIWAFVVLGISVTMLYTIWGGGSDQIYVEQINNSRKDKDSFMHSAPSSPFGDDKESFKQLNYFPPDLKFRVQASLVPVKNREVVTLTTNTGDGQSYLAYAWAEFDLDNLHNKLLILEVMEAGPERGNLFLAFADQTSAQETYGAGRYLDIKKVPGAGTITLDFNNAYNPYCAYSNRYTCPFPPKENILKVAIRAGEKSYK